MKTFLTICLSFVLFYTHSQKKPNNYFPKKSWKTSTYKKEGIQSTPLKTILSEVDKGTYGNIDQILFIKNGKVLLNQSYKNNYKKISKGKTGSLGCGYATCKDSTQFDGYNYYHPFWHPYYQNRKVHTLQSVTKSIASLITGIAIKQGHIKGVDVPLLPFFDEYDLSNVDERLKKATLENLLTMQLGIEWHEMDRPLDSTNTTVQLERSDDWIQFTLNQPVNASPGTTWSYNSGASQMMSGIIKKATGMYIDEYAKKHLFKPLGIKTYHWKKTPKGFPDTEGGLYLEAEDLAKIGYLMLRNGIWKGKQLVSPDFIQKSVSKKAEDVFPNGWDYGYQWWRIDQQNTEVWAGLGFGGQFLIIIPKLESIIVINSWNIFDQKVKDLLADMPTAVIKAHKTDN